MCGFQYAPDATETPDMHVRSDSLYEELSTLLGPERYSSLVQHYLQKHHYGQKAISIMMRAINRPLTAEQRERMEEEQVIITPIDLDDSKSDELTLGDELE